MVLSLETRIKARQDLERMMDSVDQSLAEDRRLDEIEPGMFSRAMSLNRRLLQGAVDDLVRQVEQSAPERIERGGPSGPDSCREETSAAGHGAW